LTRKRGCVTEIALPGSMSSKSSQGTGKRPVLCTVTLTAMVSPTSAVTWLHSRVAVKLPIHERASTRLTIKRPSSTYMA
jgi:hypothetical protein